MQQILDILNKVKLPEVCFNATEFSTSRIWFETTTKIEPIEGEDPLTALVNSALPSASNFSMISGWSLNTHEVINNINREVTDSMNLLWLRVNGKVGLSRTKFSKHLARSKSDKFKEAILELYLDGAKHGIGWKTIDKKTEMKAIHRFIALRYQATVEAQWPR